MTLKDIAAKAGVHVSTVSRILASPDNSFASPQVRERVWEIIRETGYAPNQNARRLRMGGVDSSAVPASSLAIVLGRGTHFDDNPFFAQMHRAIEQKAVELGFLVSFSYSLAEESDQRNPGPSGSEIKSDCAIVIGRLTKSAVEIIRKRHKTICYVGRHVLDAPFDQVICDGYEATKTAMEHLVNYGHRQIAYLGETEDEVRYRAYLDYVRAQKLDDDKSLVVTCKHHQNGGYMAAEKLLSRNGALPTAVFCAADVVAIAAMKRLREDKIKVPGQISVIGMDGIEMSGYVEPMLTTVSMPIVELGAVAVQTLIGRMSGRHKLPMKLYLPSKLSRRDSVAAVSGYVGDYVI